MPGEAKHLRDRRYGLLFRVRKSVRYHDHRRSYYRTLDASVKVLGLVVASAVFTKNFGGHTVAELLALVFIVASSASLVNRFGFKSYLHDSLYTNFISLEREFLKLHDLSDHHLNQLESTLLEIEQREPPIYSALNRYCHNEVCRIENQRKYVQPLRWYHNIFKNVFRFPNLPVAQDQAI